MDIKKVLSTLGLDPSNSIIVGSGILQALGIRQGNDIDIVVSDKQYDRLLKSGDFDTKYKHGNVVLIKDNLEIMTSWETLGKPRDLKLLQQDSQLVDGVRYLSLDFIYRVKQDWQRPKDIADIKLIDRYRLAH